MKKIFLVSGLLSAVSVSAMAAPQLTIYYSPGCPHCHHARDFIANDLIIEYPDLVTKQVNVDQPGGPEAFQAAVKDCKLDSMGVPLVVIDGKCVQGFGDEIPKMYRDDINAGLDASQVAAATANKAALDANPDAVRAKYADKTNAFLNNAQPAADVKKNSNSPMIILYGLLGILVIALGFVIFGKKKKK